MTTLRATYRFMGRWKWPPGDYVETGRYWRSESDDVVAEIEHVTERVKLYVVCGIPDATYPTLPGAKRAARMIGMNAIGKRPRSWTESSHRGRYRGEESKR